MTRRRRVLITGTSGQLGRALVETFGDFWEVTGVNRAELDFMDWRAIRDGVSRAAPNLVIHTAAATDVDGCERDPDAAYAGNAVVTRHVARAAAAVDAELVFISTNYVFDGGASLPYHEHDEPRPISVYGASKLAGESEAQVATPRCYVLRTAMLYGASGRNFVTTMRRLMRERDALTVVSDQTGNPTFVNDLALAIGQTIERAPYGTYHVTNAGAASWYDWAREIAAIDGAGVHIEPIPASAYPRTAAPPANGELRSLYLSKLQIELPDWHDALRRCLVP